jgi:glyoxylase-like metal-dependent hydrolase (beta-lactamase superfamily II)
MRRISLTNAAFEGNNNVYVFADGPETVLIDSGYRSDASRAHLTEKLGELGIALADIDRIFLTHWHGDHSGLSGEIQAESGAEVYVHADDAPLVSGQEDAWNEMHDTQRMLFEEWRMPEEKQQVLFDRMSGWETDETFPSVTTFEDGDAFSINGEEIRVTHTSGHAAGLSIFETDREGRREVFSGDALLPKYTPNVGGADVRVDRPLKRYLRALRGIADADFDRAWPGHRDPIDDPTGRAEEIIHHHEERSWRVLDVLDRQGPSDPWTVSAELFGELDGIHILHGPGESYAHLEHLEREGVIERSGTKYQLTDGTAEILASLDENRWELGY